MSRPPNRFDPLLGWRLDDHLPWDGFSTIEHGIRRNHPGTVLAEGAILAVGDSFTAGSEVIDEDTWPAWLERVTGRPVLNAGVGGYGLDQIVLRARALVPVLKPSRVLVGLLDQDVGRCGFSRYGAFKPYHDRTLALRTEHVREPRFWDKLTWSEYERADNDPLAIADFLIRGLADLPGVALVLQHGAHAALQAARSASATQVRASAAAAGVPLVDERQMLATLARDDHAAFVGCYRPAPPEQGGFGHMSPDGNWRVAELVAEALF